MVHTRLTHLHNYVDYVVCYCYCECACTALTAPSKVEGVMFGNNIVKNGRIHQEVKWNTPVLRHNAKPRYIIRYSDDSSKVLTSDSKVNYSSEPYTTLQLPFGTSNIAYYVVVAVSSTEEQGRGDYNNFVSITYTSEFITYEDCQK